MEFERYLTNSKESVTVQIPKYVSIEGNVGTGKSTVAKLFTTTHELPHIGEYTDYVNLQSGESFPIFPPKSEIDIINSNPFWLSLENRRMSHLKDSRVQYQKSIFLVERSPLSLFAFEFAKMKQNYPYNTNNLAKKFIDQLATKKISEPEAYVFLNTPPDIIQGRIVQRGGGSISFLYEAQTCVQIDYFYEFFRSKYLDKNQFINIQTDNIVPEKIVKKIYKFIKKLNFSINNNPMFIFCQDLHNNNNLLENI